jgi:Tol biopolymer transport system component
LIIEAPEDGRPIGTFHYSPAWSPDGSRIIFSAWQQGDTTNLWTTKVDGTDARRLTNDAASEDWISWTR